MNNYRTNVFASSIVDDGLHLLKSDGRYMAAHFMSHHGVSFRVIVRVLAPLEKHRPTSVASLTKFIESRE